GYRVPEHAHGSHQLIYAIDSVMKVSARKRLWLIPPQFAVWIPARTLHRIRMPGAVSMRTLYLRPRIAPGLPPDCRVIHVTPLLRELVIEAVRIGKLRARDPLHAALRNLILEQLRSASPIPISLTLPKDARALRIAQRCLADLEDSPRLSALCREGGVSVRTLERTFRRESGVDFESWRRQARVMRAIELLLAGRSVKEAAAAVGYRQAAAFVEMFRQAMGSTPKSWVRSLAGSGQGVPLPVRTAAAGAV
ncbi:MAG TPA: helix-turn-helix transcriptional regulator, partial [Bryobacteraceae bacterium]